MSCLINDEQRRQLRIAVATDLIQASKSPESFDINNYINSYYREIKNATGNEALAIDAARLIPLMAGQILMTDEALKDAMRDKKVKVGDLDDLHYEFKKDIEVVRTYVGANLPIEEQLDAAQEFIEGPKQEVEPKVETDVKPSDYKPGRNAAMETIFTEVKNEIDQTKPETYLVVTPEEERNNAAMRTIVDMLDTLSNSSEIQNDQVDGIYLKGFSGFTLNNDASLSQQLPLNSKGKRITIDFSKVYLIPVDKNGNIIPFDDNGNISKDGKLVFFRTYSETPRTANGELITDPDDIKEYVDRTKSALKGDIRNKEIEVYKALVKVINRKIEDLMDFRNPTGAKLTKEEKEIARKQAIDIINKEFEQLDKIRNYVVKGRNKDALFVITGGTKGRFIQDTFTETPLANISLPEGTTIYVEKREQAGDSDFTKSNTYLRIPGVEKNPSINLLPVSETPQIMDNIINVLTGDLYVEDDQGNLISMPAEQRLDYFRQFMLTDNEREEGFDKVMLFAEGKKGNMLKIGDKRFPLNYNDKTKINEQIAAAKAALVELFTKPFVFEKNKILRKTAENQAKKPILIDKENINNKDANGNYIAKPGVIMRERRPDGGYLYYRVSFAALRIKDKLINKNLQQPLIRQVGDKSVVTMQNAGKYNDFVIANFKTSAAVVNNEIRIVNPAVEFAPTEETFVKAKIEEISKDLPAAKTAEAKTGVAELFTQQPELAEVGTPEQYSAYLDTIFPDTQVSDVLFSTAREGKESNYLTDDEEYSKLYQGTTKRYVINMTNPLRTNFGINIGIVNILNEENPDNDGIIGKEGERISMGDIDAEKRKNPAMTTKEIVKSLSTRRRDTNVWVVNESKQKHELGTKEDIEAFKKFVGKPEAAPIEQKPDAPVTGPSTSNLTVDNISDALNLDDINLFLRNGVRGRRKQYTKAELEQKLKEAEEWYNNNTALKSRIPFRIMFAAINSPYAGIAGKWAVDGITLFHYYDENGNFDPSMSGDFTDLYHESWHAFTQTFLTQEEREDMYAELRKKKGSFTDFEGNLVTFADASWEQLEEYLAEDFREYMMSGAKKIVKGSPVRNTIFRKILNFLKELFTGVSSQDMHNPLGIPKIQQMYENLALGNLSSYNFSIENRDKTVNALYHALEARNEEYIKNGNRFLSFDESDLLVDTIDSLISDIINEQNKKVLSPEVKAKYGITGDNIYSWTTELMRNPKSLATVYTAVYNTLKNKKLPEITADYEKETDVIKKGILGQRVEALKYAIDNFGDINNMSANRDGKGVIAFHQRRSKFLSEEEKEAFFDDIDETKQNLNSKNNFDKSGNEQSMYDLAAPEVRYLLRSIHKYDSNNKRVPNVYKVDELSDSSVIWNRLARVLNGKLTKDEMYDAIRKAAYNNGTVVDPYLDELLTKLGPANTNTNSEMELWTKFWTTFCQANIPLMQMTIREIPISDDPNIQAVAYKMTIGSVNSVSRSIRRRWSNAFKNINTDYIKRVTNQEGINKSYLDIDKVIKDFGDEKGNLISANAFEFLKAIGVNLTDKSVVRDAVTSKQTPVGYPVKIFNRLKTLNEKGFKISDFNDIFKVYTQDKSINFNGLESAETELKDLSELEKRNSDSSSNYAVTNAVGNQQFEQSLHNSMSIMVSTINSAKSYKDLITNYPYMAHLDINKNPFADKSLWLNSIFDMDAYRKGGDGIKRSKKGNPNTPIELSLSNLSGVAMVNENGDSGVESAKADEFTKLIMDFHLTVVSGRPELMRHADKSTSFSMFVSEIMSPGSDNKAYVNTPSLVKINNIVEGYNSVVEILMPYVGAELERINKLKALQEKIATQKPEERDVYDANYLVEGQKFVIFERVLTPLTQSELLKYPNVDAIPVELKNTITREIKAYFEQQTSEVSELMSRAKFIDSNLILSVKNKLGNKQYGSNANIEQGLIRSYVVNSWIHNIESMSIIYGDIAQYNMAKEEFHKRNAGAGSTGKLFAWDKYSIDYVNRKGRKWGEKQGFKKNLNQDGSFDTAVLKDNEIPSYYADKLKETLKESIAARYKDELATATPERKAEIEKEIARKADDAVDPYTKLNEGDAQGWITFDFYRTLSMLQGEWSSKQEDMYNKIVNNEPIDPTTVMKFFPTKKFQYWGPLKTADDQLPINAFHKFSLFPMIPTVIQGTNLEQLHNKMMANGVDYALFKSGSKVSTITRLTAEGKAEQDLFYSSVDGQDREFDSDGPMTKNTVFLQFLKDQLYIAPYYKGSVTFPTQMRKLIENGLMEGGVPTDFRKDLKLSERIKQWNKITSEEAKEKESPFYKLVKTYEKDIADLTALKRKALEKEIGYKDGKVTFNNKLREFVIRELTRQDLADHEIDFIRLGKNNTPAHDFSISLSADKLEKVLNAIVVKRLVKQKFNGEGLIQVSNAGWEKALRGKLTEEEKAKYGTNDLPFYEVGPDGKTTAMKVMISLQGDFLNLLYLKDNEGKTIGTLERLNELLKDEKWLNTGDHRKMISITGPRIPTQENNSMEFAEVYQFLPTYAGNIVVLPSEIVAKSGGDFDIDKITFMMPNISSGINWNYWAEDPAAQKALDELKKQYPTLDLSQAHVKEVIANRKASDKTEEEVAILNAIASTSERNVKYASDLNTEEGLENKILEDIKAILELKENYASLIRPNGTDIVKPIADELASKVMKYNPRQRSDAAKNARLQELKSKKGLSKAEKDELKQLDRIDGTRVFEIQYNLYKHTSNNIGKQTLGIGAVDNTFNTIFNRVGARMNKSYVTRGGVERELDIKLPHNKVTAPNGDEVISLSHLYDATGQTSISSVIAQLINGWVDIAKDAWIFNLQGNKEISPSLLFLVQAGVPVNQAVYFVSHPLIRNYVLEQQQSKSTFSKPLGKAASNPMYFRNEARKRIFQDYLNYSDDDMRSIDKVRAAVRDTFLKERSEALFKSDEVKNFFDPANLESNLKNRIETKEYDKIDEAIFMHFLEIEDMAKTTTKVKSALNFDTSRSGNLFEALSKKEKVEELLSDGMFPRDIVEKIIDETPISSFYVQDFQLEAFGPLFQLRNNPVVNNFILGLLRNPKFKEEEGDLAKTYGIDNAEKFVGAFRNGLVPFVFQNYLHSFDIDKMKFYKGANIDSSYKAESVYSLNQSVFFTTNENNEFTAYVDKTRLKKDFLDLASTKGVTNPIEVEPGVVIGTAPVEPSYFPTADTYYQFVFEREMLRATERVSWPALKTERADIINKIEKYKTKYGNKKLAEIETMVFEEYLRDTALDNTFNINHMFRSSNSMANQLAEIMSSYGQDLMENYSLMTVLSTSETTPDAKGALKNIILTDTMLDGDKLNKFHQNLLELSDPNKIKINVESSLERQRVAKFFERLSIYAFLQSGLTATGSTSLIRLVPQQQFTRLVVPFAAKFTSSINSTTINKYYKKFVEIHSNRGLRTRLADYTIPDFNPEKDSRSGKDLFSDASESSDMFSTDNAGNIIYYPNGGTTIDGNKAIAFNRANVLDVTANNPGVMFMFDGTTDSITQAEKGDATLIHAREKAGNVIPVPVKKGFEINYNPNNRYTDVTVEEANKLKGQPITVEKISIPTKQVIREEDIYKYYGADRLIILENGKGIDVVGYKGTAAKKQKLLDEYNKNPNVDPQTGMPFRLMRTTIEAKPIVGPIEIQPGIFANEGQTEAIKKISDFIKIPTAIGTDSFFLLEGGAGVGKTTSINAVLNMFKNKKIVGATVSDEARGVLQRNMKGYETMTLAKLLNKRPNQFNQFVQVKEDENGKKLRIPIEQFNLIVIDEASMIDKDDWKLLIDSMMGGTKIIFMGDRTQIPPIGERLSNVFTNLAKTERYTRLTEPMRYAAGAPIFQLTEDKFAKEVFKDLDGQPAQIPLNKDNVIDNISSKEAVLFRKDDTQMMVDNFIEDYNKDKSTVLITWRNNTVAALNRLIRNKLLGPEKAKEEFIVGERIRFAAPLLEGKEVIAQNNAKATILSKSPTDIYEDIVGTQFKVNMEVVNKNGNIKIVPITFNTVSSQDLQKLISKRTAFWKAKNRNAAENLDAIIKSIANIDYAYAMTAHKVQGSTLNNVHIDETDIKANRNKSEVLSILRTATSRARQKIVYYTALSTNTSSADVTFEMNEKEQEELIKQQAEAAAAGTQPQAPISTTLPGPETKINIYAGTGENAELSNFANRLFEYKGRKYQTVEHAYQHQKLITSAPNSGASNFLNDELEGKILSAKTGAEAKKLGKEIKQLNVAAWDRISSKIMKELLLESFIQNPKALNQLLATGNAILTHTQDKGKWGTEFPKLLMEVRKELRGTQPQAPATAGFQGYKGGFEDKGKGTPEGDGKDKAMREVATGAIVEFKTDKAKSSSLTTLETVGQNNAYSYEKDRYVGQSYNGVKNGKNNYGAVVMLARNGKLSGTKLSEDTKAEIKTAHNQGSEFVVGDMPGVDSQFIDYLQEIGAKFTIYHTGNTSRITVTKPQTAKPTINLTDEQIKLAKENKIEQNFYDKKPYPKEVDASGKVTKWEVYKSKNGKSSMKASLDGDRTQSTRSVREIEKLEKLAKSQGITTGIKGTLVWMEGQVDNEKNSKNIEGDWFRITSEPYTPNKADFNAYENWDPSVWENRSKEFQIGQKGEWKSVRFERVTKPQAQVSTQVTTTQVIADDSKTIQPINGMTVNPVLKAKIDNAIAAGVEAKNQGYEIGFPEGGMGQYLISSAPLTFLYLSEQLFKNFRYVNPGYTTAAEKAQLPDVTQMEVPVTNDIVEDALRFCFI